MAKKRPSVQEVSYGLYEPFESEAKALPVLSGGGAFTTRVPAVVGQEFGYILKVKHGRGMTLAFEIDHPGIPDADGVVRPPFRGEVFVKSSDFDFFLGDGLWEPIEHMLGPWTLTTRLADQVVARRTFDVIAEPHLEGPPDNWDWDGLPMQ